MKAAPFLANLLSIAIASTLLAQGTAQRPSQPSPPAEDEVVRVTTNLVQIDAVVTDNDGNQVTDLRAEDFEIFEDKRPQQVSAFSYVSVDQKPLPLPAPPAPPDVKNAPPLPPTPLRPDQVRRTIVFVVDDLGLSFSSFSAVRSGLKKFVDQQMQPGDLAAVIRTSGGAGALQRLTTDKREINNAIESLRGYYQHFNRVGVHLFQPPAEIPLASAEQAEASTSLTGTLMSLTNIVRALKVLPGRKSVLFFTDSFQTLPDASDLTIGETTKATPGVLSLPAVSRAATDRLIDPRSIGGLVQAASQSSVVIYPLSAFGLQYTGPTAADRAPSGAGLIGWTADTLNQRGAQILGTQAGLQDLAHQTGGFAVINNNDLGKGIGRVIADLKGYYLIGYRPSDETFASRNGRLPYHHITLKLKRAGLHIRSRQGFYGVPDLEQPPASQHSREERLAAILESPFVAGDVRLRLTALFGNVAQGSFVRTLIHIDVRDLTFVNQPDGWHEANIDVLASSYGENGLIADYLSRSEKIRARGRTYANMLRYGVNYNLLVPIKKPGAYQLRTAIRDTATDRAGSAYQFIEVPELKKGQLALSGLLVSSTVLDLSNLSETGSVYNAPADEEERVQPTIAVRRFQRRMLLEYRYLIYNARPGPRGAMPELVAQVRLFRDGQLLLSHEEPAIDTDRLQLDPKRLSGKGAFRLGDELQPGQYVLQIVITDPQIKARSATATQWIDFEIVK
jgi:VWFA-related protein